ncbi:tetratricopeptide repeat protein [Parapedomonas caeni]
MTLKMLSRAATSALVLGLLSVGAVAIAVPAVAADKTKEEPKGKVPKASRKAQKPLGEIQKLIGEQKFEEAKPKIAEAEALPDLTADDRYFINNFKYNTALALKDNAMLEQALEAMAISEFTAETDRPKILQNLIALAFQRQDMPKAIEQSKRLLQLAPDNVDARMNLGRVYYNQDDFSNALGAFKEAIATATRLGQPVEESYYKIVAQTALRANNQAELRSAMLELVKAYPSSTNWRDALVLYRDTPGMTDPLILDSYRLQWLNEALVGERDYIEMAEIALTKRGLPGEAKSVLEKGIANGVFTKAKGVANEMLTQAKGRVGADQKSLPGLEKEARAGKTGDFAASVVGQGYLSYADYAKAIEFYQLALSKGVKNPDEVNLQLGIALVGGGRAAEALPAFANVKGALARPLADLWAAYATRKAQ